MGSSAITYILIGVSCLVSYAAFQNHSLLNQLWFYPARIKERNEWWRFITHGFVHGDFQHLIFNMLTLFFFGPVVEHVFDSLFGSTLVYPIFYLSALVFSSMPSYVKHKDNDHYRSLGASGAIASVLFTTIIFDPWQTIYVLVFPMPAILFAIAYIAYSSYMDRKGGDNIGHSAHLWGAIYGMVFLLVLKPGILPYFIQQLSHPRFF